MLSRIDYGGLRIILASSSPRRVEMMKLLKIPCEVISSAYEEDIDRTKYTPEDFVRLTSLGKAAEVFHRSPDADVVIGADTMVVAPIGSAKNTNCEKTQSVSAANILGKPKSKEEAIAILSRLSGNTHQVVTGVSILCRVPLPSQSNAAESTADADPTKVKALTEILGLISDAAVYKATCPRSAINDEAKEKGLSNPYTENPKDDPSPNAEQTESASVSSTSEAKSSSSSTSTSTSSSSLKLCFHETTSVDFDVLAQDVIQAYVDGGEPMDKAGAYGIQSEGGSFVKGIRGCYYNVVGFPLNHFARRFRQIVLALKG